MIISREELGYLMFGGLAAAKPQETYLGALSNTYH